MVATDAIAEVSNDQRRVHFLRHDAGLTAPEIARRITHEPMVASKHGGRARVSVALPRSAQAEGGPK